ncbi:2-amino-3,7-dideoxy-D-threo-hept-6-ulosonate synthase [Archaeoglobus veneficus]|uniref:2-amino-3,7-dideoxy-D-threo-hept-6-ulosonate synthase n=1 Tax=Archaeoglobus veneficus (strain DSM 11195 / SNP6) TaxID=693661 RepID=F2KPV5_ARCVS|nr:2-amino-3,7-dideoxy-D-threo-hept-6-ulosonate synthase [Archaeoglobus veneficus]AEA46462.1 phospho-2-dehydro-3-deoxyheptonate aldolase [Archaeoglobus veneficus SNP6]
MELVGKRRRMKRILKGGKALIVPMDHGITKPVEGIQRIDDILRTIDGIADAVVLHKGVVKHSSYVAEMEMGLIVHLSASTSYHANEKVIICSVEKAIELGADAVSIHVNVGSETECEQIRDAGIISEACDKYGMPLLAMMYPRGKDVAIAAETVKHAVRVGYELGADIVKTNYTGSVESFAEVVEYVPIPVVVAGGSRKSDEKLLEEVAQAMLAGAAGVAIGRNVFQHNNPAAIVKALKRVIHNGISVEEAMEVLYERNLVTNRGR